MSQEPISILAVCTGNVCRSPGVERLLASKLGPTVTVDSAGTHAMRLLAIPSQNRWPRSFGRCRAKQGRTSWDEDDVVDPFRLSDTVCADSFRQITTAVDAIVYAIVINPTLNKAASYNRLIT